MRFSLPPVSGNLPGLLLLLHTPESTPERIPCRSILSLLDFDTSALKAIFSAVLDSAIKLSFSPSINNA